MQDRIIPQRSAMIRDGELSLAAFRLNSLLLDVYFERNLTETLDLSFKQIILMTGMSRDGIRSACDCSKRLGYIDFAAGHTATRRTYTLLPKLTGGTVRNTGEGLGIMSPSQDEGEPLPNVQPPSPEPSPTLPLLHDPKYATLVRTVDFAFKPDIDRHLERYAPTVTLEQIAGIVKRAKIRLKNKQMPLSEAKPYLYGSLSKQHAQNVEAANVPPPAPKVVPQRPDVPDHIKKFSYIAESLNMGFVLTKDEIPAHIADSFSSVVNNWIVETEDGGGWLASPGLHFYVAHPGVLLAETHAQMHKRLHEVTV